MKKLMLPLLAIVLTALSCQKELSVEPDINGPDPNPIDSSAYKTRLSELRYWSHLVAGPTIQYMDSGFAKFEYYDSVKSMRARFWVIDGVNFYSYTEYYKTFNDAGFLVDNKYAEDSVAGTTPELGWTYTRNTQNEIQKLVYKYSNGTQGEPTKYAYSKVGSYTVVKVTDPYGAGADSYDLVTLNSLAHTVRREYFSNSILGYVGSYTNYEYDAPGSLSKIIDVNVLDTMVDKSYTVITQTLEREATRKSMGDYMKFIDGHDMYTGLIGLNTGIGLYYSNDYYEIGRPLKKITINRKFYNNGVLESNETSLMVYTNVYDAEGNLIFVSKTIDGRPAERVYLTYKKYK